MLEGPYFIRHGLRGMSGKAIFMGSGGRALLPNHSSAS